MDYIEKYKLCVWACRQIHYWKCKTHKHHIRPKSLYGHLAEDPKNIVVVPEIAHWAMHKWLLAHYRQTENQDAIQKMGRVDMEKFINDGRPESPYDFSRESQILDLVCEKAEAVARTSLDLKKAVEIHNAVVAETKNKGTKKEVMALREPTRRLLHEATENKSQAYRDFSRLNDIVSKTFSTSDGLDEYAEEDVLSLVQREEDEP